jgi:hypothetical protein
MRKENPMHDWENLSHVRWECKYHVVIIPKYRRKVFYGKLKREIGAILRELCGQKGVDLVDGHRHKEWIKFLELIDQQTPADLDLRFDRGQLLHPQASAGGAMAQASSAVLHALYSDQQFLAEHD